MTTARHSAIFFLAVAGLTPASAQAQWYSSASSQPPLYPYAAPSNQPYAVQVSPNTYVIKRPDDEQPQSRRRNKATDTANVRIVPSRQLPSRDVSSRNVPVRSKVDPALVEELKNRHKPKANTADVATTQVVRDKPVVVETKRYVDDPPRVVERYVDANGRPIRNKNKHVATTEAEEPIIDNRKGAKSGDKRVINAEAEITIIGPDRMSIRLYRKGDGGKAKASVD